MRQVYPSLSGRSYWPGPIECRDGLYNIGLDAAVPDSALAKRVNEISGRFKAEKNPVMNSANAELLVTEMAAKELGIAAKP